MYTIQIHHNDSLVYILNFTCADIDTQHSVDRLVHDYIHAIQRLHPDIGDGIQVSCGILAGWSGNSVVDNGPGIVIAGPLPPIVGLLIVSIQTAINENFSNVVDNNDGWIQSHIDNPHDSYFEENEPGPEY